MKTLRIFVYALILAVIFDTTCILQGLTASENNSNKIMELLDTYRIKHSKLSTFNPNNCYDDVSIIKKTVGDFLNLDVKDNYLSLSIILKSYGMYFSGKKIKKIIPLSHIPEITVRVTGYYPSGYKNKYQASIEGGRYDRYSKPLRTLQDYKHGSYVSVATDPRHIKSGTYFRIKEIPDKIFLACDVGRKIKGKKIDICVKSEALTHQLPKKVTIQVVQPVPDPYRNELTKEQHTRGRKQILSNS